ncbi:hypothetical protein RI054_35g134130 [Pseudoscourfieldia marina]
MASKCGRGWWGCGAALRGVRSTIYPSRHRNYIPTPPIVLGTMWLLPLLAKLLPLKLADWDGALDVVAATYPALKDILERQRDALKSTPLAEIVKGEHGQGDKMEKGYAILLDFMECELHSVKYYALEAVIAVLGTDPQFDRKAKQRLRQLTVYSTPRALSTPSSSKPPSVFSPSSPMRNTRRLLGSGVNVSKSAAAIPRSTRPHSAEDCADTRVGSPASNASA